MRHTFSSSVTTQLVFSEHFQTNCRQIKQHVKKGAASQMYTVQEVGEYLQRNMKNSKLFSVAPSSQITTVGEYTFPKQPVVGQL